MNTGDYLQGMRDCKDGVPQRRDNDDYLKGYAAQYEAEQVLTEMELRNEA